MCYHTSLSILLMKRLVLLKRINICIIKIAFITFILERGSSFKNTLKIETVKSIVTKYNRENFFFSPPEHFTISCLLDVPSFWNTQVCIFNGKDIVLHKYSITIKIRKLILACYRHQILPWKLRQ
jgi:hypothetical protein